MTEYKNLQLVHIIDADTGTYVEKETKDRIKQQWNDRYMMSTHRQSPPSVIYFEWNTFERDLIEYSKETPTFIYTFHGYTDLSTDNQIKVWNGLMHVSVRSYTPNPLDLVHSEHMEAFSRVLSDLEENCYRDIEKDGYPSWLVTAHRFFAIQSGYNSLEPHEDYHRLLNAGAQDVFYHIPITGEPGPPHTVSFLYYDNRGGLEWKRKDIDLFDFSLNDFKRMNITLDSIKREPLQSAVLALAYVIENENSNHA